MENQSINNGMFSKTKPSVITIISIIILSLALVANFLALLVWGFGSMGHLDSIIEWSVYPLLVLVILVIVGFSRMKKWVIVPFGLIFLLDLFYFSVIAKTGNLMSEVFNEFSVPAIVLTIAILIYLWRIRKQFN